MVNESCKDLKLTDTKWIYKGTAIPSKMYPITNKADMKFFCAFNTEELDDKKVLDIYNKVEGKMGHCYTNTLSFYLNLLNNGVDNVVPYVGWLSVGGGHPIHHAWLVINDKHLFDLSGDKIMLDYVLNKSQEPITATELKEGMADLHLSLKDIPNTERYTTGKCMVTHFYIGSPCYPTDGIQIFNQLMADFPKHPSYSNVDSEGRNELHRILAKKEKQ